MAAFHTVIMWGHSEIKQKLIPCSVYRNLAVAWRCKVVLALIYLGVLVRWIE